MITCPKCFKENQDHYKFCLGCGAELPRDASPKKFAPGTPPHGVPQARAIAPIADEVTSQGGLEPKAIAPRPKAGMGTAAMAASPAAPAPAPAAPPPAPIPQPVVAAPAPVVAAPPPVVAAPPPAAAAPAAAAGGTGIICPQCEHPNPGNNKFCASCGFKLSRPAAAAAAPEVSAIQAAPAVALSGVILTALRADGTEAGTYPLPAGNTTVGRDTGAIFAGDSYLSPRHATFSPRGAKLFVKDEGSLNGVYKKLRRDEPVLINPNDIFRIGQELLRYEPLTPLPATADGVDRLGSPSKGYMGRISLIIGRDATGNAFPVPEAGMHLGRERGDVLFPEDGYVSGLHCRLAFTNGQLFLTDLGSSNGSFVRLNGEAEVIDGDILLMGQQLFRIGT